MLMDILLTKPFLNLVVYMLKNNIWKMPRITTKRSFIINFIKIQFIKKNK